MPSSSYRQWRTVCAAALDEIAHAHVAVDGTAPGRRYTTQQINRAYPTLIASQFQGFCRDRTNLGDDKKPAPRVWLTYTPVGRLTHTLHHYLGVAGGAAVPCFALFERKVFAGKQEAVIDFLKQFGLSRAEAEEVIAAVGTGP